MCIFVLLKLSHEIQRVFAAVRLSMQLERRRWRSKIVAFPVQTCARATSAVRVHVTPLKSSRQNTHCDTNSF